LPGIAMLALSAASRSRFLAIVLLLNRYASRQARRGAYANPPRSIGILGRTRVLDFAFVDTAFRCCERIDAGPPRRGLVEK